MLQNDLSLPYLERESSNKEEKLMILIHGYGSNEADLFSFSGDLPKNLKIISCQAPYSTGYGGYSWYDIQLMDGKKYVNYQEAKSSIELLVKFIEELSVKYAIKHENISLLGFSQGAILSNAIALNHPDKLKNIVMLSGYYEEEIEPKDKNKDYSHLNYFISHGREDAVIPFDWAEKTPLKLKELGIKQQFKSYNSGHGIAPENYHDMMAWIVDNV